MQIVALLEGRLLNVALAGECRHRAFRIEVCASGNAAADLQGVSIVVKTHTAHNPVVADITLSTEVGMMGESDLPYPCNVSSYYEPERRYVPQTPYPTTLTYETRRRLADGMTDAVELVYVTPGQEQHT